MLKASPEKTKEMQERARERNLITQQMKKLGPSTTEELAKATGLDVEKLLQHLIAMRQFGRIEITGQRNKYLVYSLIEEK